MRIFVTGATGFVGSAVVRELLSAGYQVLGMARSEDGAKAVEAAGAQVHRCELTDLDNLKKGADSCDGVIHTAFRHDFSKFVESCEIDRSAIEAIGSVLEGSQRPLLVTGGLALLATGRVATEEDTPPPPGPTTFPRASEVATAQLVERGVNAAIVRLAPSTHGEGDHGFIPILIGIAREKGVAAYVDEGLNRWPGVHRLDAAVLYRLALEKCTPGARYHACDEEGVPFKEIAAVIGKRLNVPVESRPADHFGWFGRFAGMDIAASSAWTRKTLGWEPKQPGLLADIDQPGYFAAA